MYHLNRIEHSYIPNLRPSFKAYDAFRKRNDTNISKNSSPLMLPYLSFGLFSLIVISMVQATLKSIRDLLSNHKAYVGQETLRSSLKLSKRHFQIEKLVVGYLPARQAPSRIPEFQRHCSHVSKLRSSHNHPGLLSYYACKPVSAPAQLEKDLRYPPT